MSHDSLVGIVPTGWTTEEFEYESRKGKERWILYIFHMGVHNLLAGEHLVFFPRG
jgi:hypothetical protein